MPFLKTFQLSMYAQVFLASGLLAAAEGGASPAYLTFVVGLVALIFNDSRREFGLSEWWANGLALGAFLVASWEFMGDSQESKLLAGTHLIIYLLWIVLLWNREMRHFWWICALCLLHVALAAVLTQASWFGMVLVVYVLFMVWNLTLFSLYRAEEEVVSAPTVFASDTGTALLQASGKNAGRHSRVQGNVQSDFGRSRVGSRLAFGSLVTSLSGLLVGSAIFVMTPRVWIPPKKSEQAESPNVSPIRSVTGFTEEVQLGDIGEILESSEPVLSVQVVDNDTNTALDVIDFANSYDMNEPYLRGSVLVKYSAGKWQTGKRDRDPDRMSHAPRLGSRGWIRQDITLEPMGTKLLFAMRPFCSGNFAIGERDGNENALFLAYPSYTISPRTSESGSKQIRYRIYSRPPTNPPSPPKDFSSFRYIETSQKGRELTAVPESQKLKALAQQVAARVNRESLQGDEYTLAVARALESHLRDSGEYTYSLSAAVMDPTIDPVDDFLFNRKSGHCEYYAAALTLMLRSVGIPARLINGFKGGEYDAQEKVLRVEQRHAHSWVEAAIGDHWLTMDATPAAERQRIVASHKPGYWEVLKRTFWGFWRENVVSFSLAKQRREIFEPMLDYLQKAFSSTAGMRAAAVDFWNWFYSTVTNPQRWISIDGGILVFLLLGVPVLIFHWTSKIWRRLRGRWARRKSAHAGPTRLVEFYQRFQVLTRRMGFVRQPQQTQREYAAAIQQVVDATAEEPEMNNVSNEIADSFYRVRFGDDPLNAEEQRQVDQQLQLMEALSKRRPR
ncbi:Protein-glutamine gamma-glutamyltransferase [Symmachiella dynata]|uniref:Protein-glutamine gamma-glutamyltransferase n=1 Tax=Symmachiella dynata TaxID=2527995 RepID=A0A517ZWU8_9PLAN|nr:DUF3488 and transglutaminase-like domain-containing protein [Symmachiella dynata]QDU46926.1 Protein-glutamine gamma-glutamyltransferase [Symmachiella dynata]